jgi:acyl-coenzyme A thioesterase PaaI-like protein
LQSLQPNSLHCFVCGVKNPFGLKLKFYESAPGEVTSEIILNEQYQGYPGTVHGGIVAAMLDEVSGRAFMGSGDNPRFMYTARLEIRYRRHVPIGELLRLVGHAQKSRSHSATATGRIYDREGNLLAECDALLVDVPEDVVTGTDLDALGWKVYD